MSFCLEQHVCPLPASTYTITYFAVALSRRLSPATINVYLAAVSTLHKENALHDPVRGNPQLKAVMKGIRRAYMTTPRHRRQPITINILSRLLNSIQVSRNIPHHNRRMLAAAFTLAFYGLLRVSEFTIPSLKRFNPRYHPLAKHIVIHRKFYTFFLSKSKTDQHQQGHLVYVHRSSHNQCPLRYMKQYIYGKHPPKTNGPLFVFKNGQPLTRRLCLYYLRHYLYTSGYSPQDFNTHSFRIGGATTAAQKGISKSNIKRLGRWKSRAYKRYVRQPTPTSRLAAAQLAS